MTASLSSSSSSVSGNSSSFGTVPLSPTQKGKGPAEIESHYTELKPALEKVYKGFSFTPSSKKIFLKECKIELKTGKCLHSLEKLSEIPVENLMFHFDRTTGKPKFYDKASHIEFLKGEPNIPPFGGEWKKREYVYLFERDIESGQVEAVRYQWKPPRTQKPSSVAIESQPGDSLRSVPTCRPKTLFILGSTLLAVSGMEFLLAGLNWSDRSKDGPGYTNGLIGSGSTFGAVGFGCLGVGLKNWLHNRAEREVPLNENEAGPAPQSYSEENEANSASNSRRTSASSSESY